MFFCPGEEKIVYCDLRLASTLGYQRFFLRAAGIFGVGLRPTHLRPLASSCSFGIMIIIMIVYSHAVNR